jgi:hypothetical protein
VKTGPRPHDNDRWGRARPRNGGNTLDTVTNYTLPAAAPAPAAPAGRDLPVLEVRFPATYAWGAMAFGCVFFLLGLVFALLNHHRNPGPGLLISTAALVAVIGANYWRGHLHVVVRLTPRQLVLRREGAVDWDAIAHVQANTIDSSYRGTATRSQFVCIKLKSPPAPKGRLDGFLRNAKRAISGYDIIVPGSELSCTADWFVAECRKRMAAAGASGLDGPSSHPRSAATPLAAA